MGILRTLLLASLASCLASAAAASQLVVYTAKKIITMEPALPEATAVAVADGRIVRWAPWNHSSPGWQRAMSPSTAASRTRC